MALFDEILLFMSEHKAKEREKGGNGNELNEQYVKYVTHVEIYLLNASSRIILM